MSGRFGLSRPPVIAAVGGKPGSVSIHLELYGVLHGQGGTPSTINTRDVELALRIGRIF